MTKANFVAESYDAFSAMLLVNQGLFLFLPKLSILAEENLANSYNLMEIEQRLNEAGRGEPLLPMRRQDKHRCMSWMIFYSQMTVTMPTISCSVAFTS
jgi:hypothetical protein